jgi:predicted transposase YdaD
MSHRHNPHDKLLQAVFSDPANAVAHFAVCLPPKLVAALDLSEAKHVPGSWVDEALRDRHSDVVHSVPFRSACSAGADALDGQTEGVLL